jgi:hypothetical protein
MMSNNWSFTGRETRSLEGGGDKMVLGPIYRPLAIYVCMKST